MILRVGRYKYIATKRDADAFCGYMKRRGWSVIKKSAVMVVVEKDGRKLTYNSELKRFCVLWISRTVIYRSIKFK